MHEFLLIPARWRALGAAWDAEGRERAADGWTEVEHGGDAWTLRGRLRLLGPEPAEFENVYRIALPSAGARVVRWQSHNPALGPLAGSFCFVGETILSHGAGADGAHLALESLTRIEPWRYANRGVLLRADVLLGSWAMELTRAGAAGT